MTIYLDRGPFLTIPDKLHPGQYKVIRNPDWHGELPEIVSFTDFLKWNYTLEYGRHIRELHYYRQIPLPWGVPREADIETVIIEEGRYDRINNIFTDHSVRKKKLFKFLISDIFSECHYHSTFSRSINHLFLLYDVNYRHVQLFVSD